MKLAEENSSSSKADDEESKIVAEPMSAAASAQPPTIRVTKSARRERGIVIREPLPQGQQET